jgi:hypothetical protein
VFVGLEDLRLLQQPPALESMAGVHYDAGSERRRHELEGVVDGGRQVLLRVHQVADIQIGPQRDDACGLF